MTIKKLSPFILILILSIISCSNNATQEQEAAKQETVEQEPITEVNPVLVANKEHEDSTKEKPVAEAKKESAIVSPPPASKINKKPAASPVSKVEEKAEKVEQEKQPQSNEEIAPTTPAKPVVETEEKEEVKQEEETIQPIQASHEAWDVLLKKYVSADGKVNYRGFKNSKSELQAYLDHLDKNPVQDNWSRNDQMAYWINAYNAFTVKLIVDNYPVKSIMDLHGGKPWDVKWIKLGGKTYSLNQIEHDILRPKYKDARIHFAVNCAATSCPPLLNRAWRGSNLNSTFDQQAKKFINNSKYNKIAVNQVQLSKIFEWYAGDFGNIIDYLNQYSTTKIKSGAKVSYLEYGWALNE